LKIVQKRARLFSYRGDNHRNSSLKIFFSRTTVAEELTFTGKLSHLM
jgi:hypothetical protein